MTDTAPSPIYRASVASIFAAWLVPIMIIGQFAFLAAIPVIGVLVAVLRHSAGATLRRSTIVLASVSSVPWLIWAVRPDPAQSLSKDMHPAIAAVVTLAAVTVAGLLTWTRTRPATTRLL